VGSFITRRPISRLVLLAAACIAAVSSAATPRVRETIIIPLTLPANYQPASLPARPLDDGLRVAFVPPLFDRAKSATWTAAVKWEGSIWNPTDITEVDTVFVNFAEPVATTLPKIIRRVFPKTEVFSAPRCAECDLVFTVDLRSSTFADDQGNLAGVAVTAAVKAVAGDGTAVTSFSAEGIGRITKSIYWSSQTRAKSLGIPALQEVLEQLVRTLLNDPALTEFVKKKAAERARPSDLETAVAFDDAASLLPNGRLDAGEHARLRFTIRNQGAGPAFAARLRLGTTANAVAIPGEIEVGDIAPGGTKEIDIPIGAGLDVETAAQQLRVETLEKRGYGGRVVVVQLATERLKRPTLEIADIRLEDRGGRALGDGDGRASNGETLEAVILVRNGGPGDAVGAVLTISSVPGVEVVDSSLKVGAIPVNAVKEVRTALRIPITFNGPDVGLTLHLMETRGAAVAVAERIQRWALQVKRSQIEVGFRLFDGNSPRSRGNRDGVANNGETLEVALIPGNRGTLAARGVRLTLTSAIAGVSMKPASIEIGELPPLVEGAEHRVQLTIPRALGSDGVLQRLPLNVTIAQADFPASEQLIGLPFHTQRPQLIAAVAGQSSLVEGKSALFTLDIRNQGPLAAEDVKVDVSSDHSAVELLDESGTPARTVRVDVGSISPETAARRIQFRAHVRRNVGAVRALVKALVSQRDFGAVAVQAALTILKEEATLISAIPPAVPEIVVPYAPGVPATISFQRYRDGNRLADETAFLTFEVQSQTQLETVRLEHNRRAIELPRTAEIRTAGGYLWQYDPQVRLEYGANEFEVVVITSEGVRNSRAMTLHREKPRGKIWLAVVGVSNYREPSIGDLDFAKDDAVAVRAYYRQLGVPNEQVIELLNEHATLANIKRMLGTELVKHAANPDDTVLIYFAGHGQMEADRSSPDSDGYSKYLLPHDANPADLFGSALSMEELSRIVQRLSPERVVLIIDSCFSGAAGGRTPYEPNAPSRGVIITEEFLTRMANSGTGRVILTASGSREVAQESHEKRHGIFTYFLLEGLRGAADIDRDGRVDVDEIYKFVSQKVSSATRGRQNPMRKSPNLSGTVYLGGRLQ
jgi:hypothetical protein